MRLRDYQVRAVGAVHHAWQHARSVCLVAPTGAGKTVLGAALVSGSRTIWLAHRRELVHQAAERLRATLGAMAVASPQDPNPAAQVYVTSVQALARGQAPFAPELVVADEAHHYRASQWATVVDRYSSARLLGLTATPERRDGRPLGDMFDRLVVAARYSELLAGGYLVPCRIWRPTEAVQRGLAQDPLAAYQRYCPGERAFIFVATVQQAYELAARAREAGVPAETIEAKTPKPERDAALLRFASGATRVLTNVYALTEGVDVPAASACILARSAEHVGMYLQIAGRVLRPSHGKSEAKLIDLVGASLAHGSPTSDRDYSLEGEGIREAGVAPLRNCLQCGSCYPASIRTCPECGWEPPPPVHQPPRIYDLALQEVYDGATTPADAKRRELERLMGVARRRGWGLYAVQKEYQKLFHETPDLRTVATAEDRQRELGALRRTAAQRGYKPGWAAHRYKQLFGVWP